MGRAICGNLAKVDISFVLQIATLALTLGLAMPAPAQYKVVHAFSKADGSGPWGSLVVNKKGVLFGTTASGGGGGCNGYGCGVVFKLRQRPDGKWVETVLHSFDSNGQDGIVPYGGPVIGDGGHIYGTTWIGGALGAGTVFELSHTPSGWEEGVLYSFGTENNDGGAPVSGLVVDEAGNLYGTAAGGPGSTAFELSPGPEGWSESILHHFGVESGDGAAPYAGLILDASGNLYGATTDGGKGCTGEGCGTVYKLKPQPDGSWKETVLHRFNNDGKDGVNPGWGSLFMDASGRLYGTTRAGGPAVAGIIYRLTHQPDGHWKESILYNFKQDASGYSPNTGVVMDSSGNLYGTTDYGGAGDCGVIYKLAPGKQGQWTYTVLHTFTGPDGCLPEGNLVPDNNGNYGATALGGDYGAGVVFMLTP